MFKRWFLKVLGALLFGLLAIGYVSGIQPKRDALAQASNQFGIALEQQTVDVGDVSLNVVFAGPADGEPVILLHGYPEFWYAWRGVMAELAKAGFRVIVPDQRGYNQSDKPASANDYTLDKLASDVQSLAHHLGYQRVFLAGHDFGGQVAWWTLILYPDLVESFIIINKPHPQAIKDFSESNPSISWYRTFLRIPYLPDYVARLANWHILAKNLRETSQPDTFSKTHLDQFRSAWDYEGAIHSMNAWYRANANFDMGIGKIITTPGAFLLAPNDAFSPIEMGKLTMSYLPNAQLVELTEGTHWVIQEQPLQVANLMIKQFNSEPLNAAPRQSN